MKREDCPHFTGEEAAARGEACESCGARFSLRVCTTCGHVGCCESQQGHNTKHSRATKHPVIRALTRPAGQGFLWCYECRAYLD